MSRGGARRQRNTSTVPVPLARRQGLRSVGSSSGDIVTPEDALELELSEIASVMRGRLLESYLGAIGCGLELERLAAATSSRRRRSPVSFLPSRSLPRTYDMPTETPLPDPTTPKEA